MCLNEEDGLEFKVLQETDGSRSALRVFWLGYDVTEMTSDFEYLTKDHPLRDIFQLRVVALLQDRLRQQIERLYESEQAIALLAETTVLDADRQRDALRLRERETSLLENVFTEVEEHVS